MPALHRYEVKPRIPGRSSRRCSRSPRTSGGPRARGPAPLRRIRRAVPPTSGSPAPPARRAHAAPHRRGRAGPRERGAGKEALEPGHGAKIASIAMHTWIYVAPSDRSTKLGYLRAGAVVDRAEAPGGHRRAAPGGWYRDRAARLRLRRQGRVARARSPGRRGRASAGRIGTAAALPVRRPRGRRRRTSTSASPRARIRSASRAPRSASPPRRLGAGASSAPMPLDPVPAFLADGRDLPKPYGAEEKLHYSVHTGRAKEQSAFGLITSFDWTGRRFGLTTELDLIPLDRTKPAHPSTFHGIVVEQRGDARLRDPPGRDQAHAPTRSGTLHEDGTRRVPLRLGAHRQDQRAPRMLRDHRGRLARRRRAWSSPTSATIPAGFAAEGKKWIDVSIRKQILVAYEGRRAVYATLVSTRHRRHGRSRRPRTPPCAASSTSTRSTSPATMDGDEAERRLRSARRALHPVLPRGLRAARRLLARRLRQAAQPRLREPRARRRRVALRVDRPGRARRSGTAPSAPRAARWSTCTADAPETLVTGQALGLEVESTSAPSRRRRSWWRRTTAACEAITSSRRARRCRSAAPPISAPAAPLRGRGPREGGRRARLRRAGPAAPRRAAEQARSAARRLAVIPSRPSSVVRRLRLRLSSFVFRLSSFVFRLRARPRARARARSGATTRRRRARARARRGRTKDERRSSEDEAKDEYPLVPEIAAGRLGPGLRTGRLRRGQGRELLFPGLAAGERLAGRPGFCTVVAVGSAVSTGAVVSAGAADAEAEAVGAVVAATVGAAVAVAVAVAAALAGAVPLGDLPSTMNAATATPTPRAAPPQDHPDHDARLRLRLRDVGRRRLVAPRIGGARRRHRALDGHRLRDACCLWLTGDGHGRPRGARRSTRRRRDARPRLRGDGETGLHRERPVHRRGARARRRCCGRRGAC